MAIQGSGAISFSDLAEEFGDTTPHSFSEFYREGGLVPGVNSSVAASGAIRLGTFYNAVNELLQTVTASASINAQTIFGSDWGSAVPKRLSIPSGVTIGPLTIPSGMGGTLEVDVAGNIYGTGGSSNGGAGGHAITSSSTFVLNVFSGGSVRGGGGGGGKGGTGGNGSYNSNEYRAYAGANEWATQYGALTNVIWGGVQKFYVRNNDDGWVYSAGSQAFSQGDNGHVFYAIQRNKTFSTTGGAGGNGGVGQGYNQSASSGAGGSAGGTNAGTGGTGGSGGGFATAGSTGSTGANGNASSGSAGSGGGAAGRAVLMNAGSVTVNNSGTINGAY